MSHKYLCPECNQDTIVHLGLKCNNCNIPIQNYAYAVKIDSCSYCNEEVKENTLTVIYIQCKELREYYSEELCDDCVKIFKAKMQTAFYREKEEKKG